MSAIASPQSEGETRRIVDRLGKPGTSFGGYEALDTNRCIALPLLVSALAKLPPVEPGKVGGALGRSEDSLTSRTNTLLRALRALTAHDEYGPISQRGYRSLPTYREVPGGAGILQRDSLIRGLPRGRSRFYGFWMSRGTYFYAPKATQLAIKAQWRRFVAKFDCRKRLPKGRWDPSFFNG
jgi:hypothetical protein